MNPDCIYLKCNPGLFSINTTFHESRKNTYASQDECKMYLLALSLGGLLCGVFNLSAQIVPSRTGCNQDIVWENVFTDGPAGKVNRAAVDSDGNCVVIFMPDNQSRIRRF